MVNVPEWMFIKWLPQILSRFDFSKPCFLDELVMRMAIAYPFAIIYPFQVSYSQFREKHPNVRNRELVHNLLERLNNPMVDNFIKSITCLCLPNKLLSHHLENLFKMVQYSQELNQVKYQNAVKNLISIAFENNLQGKIFSIIESNKKILEELVSMDG